VAKKTICVFINYCKSVNDAKQTRTRKMVICSALPLEVPVQPVVLWSKAVVARKIKVLQTFHKNFSVLFCM